MLPTNSCWSSNNFFCFRVIVDFVRATNLDIKTKTKERNIRVRKV